MSSRFDPTRVVAFNEVLASIAEEMGVRLERSSFSANIKERRDYSCALFDTDGQLIAQAAHIPVHLGAMSALVRALIPRVQWREGDTIACNDPFLAGTHLPDISLVSPVYVGDRLAGFVASRAHHADVGGVTPGSMPNVPDLFGEGFRIPPVRLTARGRVVEDVMSLVCSNSRRPDERRGDLLAQIAANRSGAEGLRVLAERYGATAFRESTDEAIAYAEALTRGALRSLPDGEYSFEDCLDSDGVSAGPVRIRVRAEIASGSVRFDFSGSDPQRPAGINATLAVTESACLYAVRCLLDPDAPTNEGCRQPIRVLAPQGTVVNASYPAAVAGGNVETSQRITDVVLGALAQAAPERIPAASQGTMNNLTFGGWDPKRRRAFAYYETIGGGGGASATRDGTLGLHSHMTNTRNTPVEALEQEMPIQVIEYCAGRPGGEGLHRGGAGVRKTFRFLVPVTGSLLADRRRTAPYGVSGGRHGRTGMDVIVDQGKQRKVPAKGSFSIGAGGTLTVNTPSGGGWGTPP
ncbi:MAG: N-methylhydantoinase B [Fimbriimonadales bacterium]